MTTPPVWDRDKAIRLAEHALAPMIPHQGLRKNAARATVDALAEAIEDGRIAAAPTV